MVNYFLPKCPNIFTAQHICDMGSDSSDKVDMVVKEQEQSIPEHSRVVNLHTAYLPNAKIDVNIHTLEIYIYIYIL